MFDAKSDDGRCQNIQANTIAEFSKQPYSDWFEPSNWIKEGEISPIPHQEQVPCRYDTVVIPQESAPKVKKWIIKKNLSIRFPLEAKANIGLVAEFCCCFSLYSNTHYFTFHLVCPEAK